MSSLFIMSDVHVVDGIQDPDKVMKVLEICGRSSHASAIATGTNTSDSFVRKIVRLGHESVLEHASITVKVMCDRATAQQWTRYIRFLSLSLSSRNSYDRFFLKYRHRLAAYTMESQRYVRHDGSFADPEFRGSSAYEAYGVSAAQCRQAQIVYTGLIDSGIPPEDARSILPNCAMTTFYSTANIRSWRHFLLVRCAPAAQHVIRRLALKLLNELYIALPACFYDLHTKYIKN